MVIRIHLCCLPRVPACNAKSLLHSFPPSKIPQTLTHITESQSHSSFDAVCVCVCLLLGGLNLNSGCQDLKACTGSPRPPGGSVHTCEAAPGGPHRGRLWAVLVRQCRRAHGHVLASDQASNVQDPACAQVWPQVSDSQQVTLTSGPLFDDVPGSWQFVILCPGLEA